MSIMRYVLEAAAEGTEGDTPQLDPSVAPDAPSELDNLAKMETEAEHTGDYDALHQKTQELITDYQEQNPPEAEGGDGGDSFDDGSGDDGSSDGDGGDAFGDGSSDDSTGSDDAPDDDSSSDDASSDDKKSDEDEKKDDEDADPQEDKGGKKQTVATESLRREYYNVQVLESIEWDDVKRAGGAVARGIGEVSRFTASMLGKTYEVLKELGIQYGPGVLMGMKKTVLYLFTKSASLLLGMIIAAAKFQKRLVNSFTKRRSQIGKLRAEVLAFQAQAKESKAKVEFRVPGSRDPKLISWLTAGTATSPMESAAAIEKFMTLVVGELDRQIMNDLQSVRKLIDLSETRIAGNPLDLLRVSPLTGNFAKRRVQGYSGDSNLVETSIYDVALPDRVLFIANLPRQDVKGFEDIREAYQASGVFLGVDNSQRPQPDMVDYMDANETLKFLDALESICGKGLEHGQLYRRIIQANNALKFGYKHYYQKLVADEKEATVRNTLVEFVYLKQSFVSRTYLPATMDIHDYAADFVAKGLSYARESIRSWRVVEPSSAD